MSPHPDLVCFSHLRWGFVYQRPNHLMARWANERRVFFIEEPTFDEAGRARLEVVEARPGLWVCTPRLGPGLSAAEAEAASAALVRNLLRERAVVRPLVWIYSPMMLPLAEGIEASAVVHDCMDELSGFLGAPAELRERERALMSRADLVFTGGHSLHEARRGQHPSVHAFPSSVDAAHFERARLDQPDPPDQAPIGLPRLGFFGVIDERMDLALLAALAEARPAYEIVMLGPVVKIDPDSLPRRGNLHYLGMKRYEELPAYLAGWDVALMPFALNAATRFISPTKTLEYMAAGKPVVSTPIHDVVHPYGERGLVLIGDTPGAFIAAVDRALSLDREAHRAACDEWLRSTSWDQTWAAMRGLVLQCEQARREGPPARPAMPSHPVTVRQESMDV